MKKYPSHYMRLFNFYQEYNEGKNLYSINHNLLRMDKDNQLRIDL